MLERSNNFKMRKCFLPIFVALLPGAYCRLCHVTSLFLESPLLVGSNKTDSSIYQCPQPGDPHTFTDCCIMEPNEKPRPCCEPKTIGFLPGMDDETFTYCEKAFNRDLLKHIHHHSMFIKCYPKARYTNKKEVLIIVSIGVIAACLLCSIMVLICCFWSKCPLHSACSVNYKHNEAIAFSTKEERQKLNGMPNEEYGDHMSNPIKIRPVADV